MISVDAWRVVVGTLPALLAAGYEVCVHRATWVPGATGPDGEAAADNIAAEALAWAVERWSAADHVGEPPTLADAVAVVLDALPKRERARERQVPESLRRLG